MSNTAVVTPVAAAAAAARVCKETEEGRKSLEEYRELAEAEWRFAQAIATLEAMAPNVVFIDEEEVLS
jgi:hypothetical protein